MTLLYPKDPLISELKGYTSKLLESYNKGISITDSHPLLLNLEQCLENIFHCSIKAQTALFGYLYDGSAWRWIEKTAKSDNFYDENYQITGVITSVKKRKNILTQDGRFRLALRYCLVRKCLHRPIEYLRDTKTWGKYYLSDAILADEILTEILLSVVYQLNIVNFKLNLENSGLLDLSWELPRIVEVDLVPSKNLGISFKFSGERAVIVKIIPNSVAFDCYEINIGDIIESINNVQITAAIYSSLNSLLKTPRIQPITLKIIKAIADPSNDCRIHPAMLQLYKNLKLDPETVRNSLTRNLNVAEPNISKLAIKLKALTGFKVVYLGNVSVGRNNEAKIIDRTFATFYWPSSSASKQNKVTKQEVFLEIGELGTKVTSIQSNRLIDRHLFMEITACSPITLMPTFFAYIAGRSGCSQNFRCYFFIAPSSELAGVILQLMEQGFRRTNYAV